MFIGYKDEDEKKLMEKLPDKDKGYIEGFEYAIEYIRDCVSANITDIFAGDIPSLEKVEDEIAEVVLDEAVTHMELELKEIKTSFINNNDYCIDDDGNVVKDE